MNNFESEPRILQIWSPPCSNMIGNEQKLNQQGYGKEYAGFASSASLKIFGSEQKLDHQGKEEYAGFLAYGYVKFAQNGVSRIAHLSI